MDTIFFRGVITAFIVFLLACSDPTGDSQVEAAKKYLAEKRYREATIEFKNALQENPRHVEARWLLGQQYFAQKSYKNAIKELDRARALGKSDQEVLPILAKALLLEGEFTKLEQLPVKNITGEVLSTVLAAQGISKLRFGQKVEAAMLIRKAVDVSPDLPFVLVAEARLLGQHTESDWTDAKALLEKAVEIDPSYAEAWILLGDLQLRGLNAEEAEKAYSMALEGKEISLESVFKRALLRLEMGKTEEVRQDLAILTKRAPKSLHTKYLQGIISFIDKEFEEAVSSFEMSKARPDKFPRSFFFLATAHQIMGNQAQAEDNAYRYLSIFPNSVPGRKLLATIKLRKGEYEEVESLIKPIIDEQSSDTYSLRLLSSAMLKQGRVNQGLHILQMLARAQPDSPEVQTKLGAGLIASGNVSKGLEHIDNALKIAPDLQVAELVKVAAHIQDKNFSSAFRVIDEFEEKYPDNRISYILRGEVFSAQSKNDKAKKAFKKALEIEPGNPTASDKLALLAIQNQDFEEANNLYQDVLKHYPNHLTSLMKLVSIANLLGHHDEMESYLKQAIEAHPTEPRPKVILAKYYLTTGRSEQAPSLINELNNKEKSHPEVLKIIGEIHFQNKEYLLAKETYERLTAINPKDSVSYFSLARTYRTLGEKDKALSTYEKAIEISQNYLPPHIEIASLHLAQKNVEEAESKIREIEKIAPNHLALLSLSGALANLQGDKESALKNYKALYDRSPNTTTLLKYAEQLRIMGRSRRSQEVLSNWLNDFPKDVPVRMEVAALMIDSGKSDNAIDQYEIVISHDENHIRALNNLAWLLQDSDPKTALAHAEKAVSLGNEAAELMDTLALVLMKNNELSQALRTAERALAKQPNNPDIKYHTAMIHSANGNNTESKALLIQLIESHPEFADVDSAKKLLGELN